MAWSITDYFPSWGDSGEQPSAGFNYQGGDQVNEKHLDYLWSSLHDIQDEIQAALNDIDSDGDGIVDEADFANDVDSTAIAGNGLKASGGDLLIEPADFAGNGLQDDGSDNLTLTENSVSVTAGDGLKGGGSVALGGSTTLNVEPADFAGAGLADDGNDNLELAVATGMTGGEKSIMYMGL